MLRVTEIPVVEPPKIDQRTDWMKRHDKKVLSRVRRGLAALQKEHGDDWVDYINPVRLNMASGSACILGQIYGSYSEGMEKLRLPEGRGFEAMPDASYPQLQEAWLDAYHATKG